LTLAACALLMGGCTFDKGEVPIQCDPQEEVSYSSDIKPLLNARCNTIACHTSGFAPGDFTTHQGILPKFDNGSLKRRIVEQTMPAAFKITDAEIQTIVCWVNAGAPNN